jgi:hypothetical protein
VKILGYILAAFAVLILVGAVFGEAVAAGIGGAIGGAIGLFGLLYVFGFGGRMRRK